MKFTTSDRDIKKAIDILDNLVNTEPQNAIEAIRNYKISRQVEDFTSFRVNKEIMRFNRQL